MKSFDEFYKKSEWFGSYQSEEMMSEAYDAGAQSRQSEVDELTGKLKNSEYLRDEHLEARRRLYKDNCELQKRIDDALFELEQLHLLRTANSNNAIKILKGENHES